MPRCDYCSTATTNVMVPPDMIDEADKNGKRMCHFCKNKTDTLIGTDGTVYKKGEVIVDYNNFLDEIYTKPELYVKFNKSMIDAAVAHKDKKLYTG